MVSSETGGVVDCSVGSIVWVRRRNGSWWPGKILGPEELSSSLLTSPRSGTPVKLLGREDASVDWYNLEKSKRVKDFRCGDFDECIERAEAAHGMPSKKREKYARREDAILHALELEKQLPEKKYGKLGHSSNGRYKKSPSAVTSSRYMEYVGRTQENLRSDQVRGKLGSSLVQKNATEQYLYDAPVVEGDQLSGDDDSPDALPRMRGLQEFGLRTAPRVREEPSGVAVGTKRSRYTFLPYDSADSSNDNQIRPSRMEVQLSKFKETGDLAYVDEDRISQSTENTETDCSETESMVSDSDDDLDALSDFSASIELRPKYPGRMREDLGSMSSSDDLDEVNDLSHPFPYASMSTSTAMSEWQLKGKRNSRMLGKRYLDQLYINGDDSNWSNSDYKYSMSNNRKRYAQNDAIVDTVHYWEDHNDGERVMLVDVDLTVEANNYRRDVPMTSVMSKLNGHAIIGHPIRIEPLENGCSGKLVGVFPESLESSALSPVWRTGRRTANSRVPRPHLSSTTLDGDAINHYGKLSRKKTSPSSSNQKIRTLSSIALEQNHHPRVIDRPNTQVDIKSEYVPPTVACIPVNLVFSRLHEELVGRHP